jgi:hypothetical protein
MVGPDGELFSRSAAQQRADTDSRLFPIPPGARLQAGLPPSPLENPPGGSEYTQVVKETRWWTVPGTSAAVLAWVTHHPPAGYAPGDSGSTGGGTATSWVGFDPTPTRTGSDGVTLELSLAQSGDQVELRADVQVVWFPTRTAIETIPDSATEAAVVYQGPTMLPTGKTPAPPLHATLTGASLHQLATALNALIAEPPEIAIPCPAPNGEATTIRLSYGGHEQVFTATFGGCGDVQVTSDGVGQPALTLTDAFATAVHRSLHITAAEDPGLSNGEK